MCAAGRTAQAVGHHVVLFDGVCGLCNRTVQFILRRDPQGRFRFAALQSALARQMLEPLGARADDLDTVYVLADFGTPSQRLLRRGRAVLFVASQLGFPWRAAAALRVLPTALLDLAYRVVARWRYRLFGKYDSCPVPKPEERARFLDG